MNSFENTDRFVEIGVDEISFEIERDARRYDKAFNEEDEVRLR